MLIREATPGDLPFLWQVSFEAAYPPGTERPATIEEAATDDHVARYLDGWGRGGDIALVGMDEAGIPIGAAWFRTFTAACPGYGFVNEDTPELSIGIVPAWRGRGAGRALLAALQEAARQRGVAALSLSVDATNEPAVRLYRSAGFRTVGGEAHHPTMLWTAGTPDT